MHLAPAWYEAGARGARGCTVGARWVHGCMHRVRAVNPCDFFLSDFRPTPPPFCEWRGVHVTVATGPAAISSVRHCGASLTHTLERQRRHARERAAASLTPPRPRAAPLAPAPRSLPLRHAASPSPRTPSCRLRRSAARAQKTLLPRASPRRHRLRRCAQEAQRAGAGAEVRPYELTWSRAAQRDRACRFARPVGVRDQRP